MIEREIDLIGYRSEMLMWLLEWLRALNIRFEFVSTSHGKMLLRLLPDSEVEDAGR